MDKTLPNGKSYFRIIFRAWAFKQWLKRGRIFDMDENKEYALLPYCSTVAVKLERLLGKNHIRVMFKPASKVQ